MKMQITKLVKDQIRIDDELLNHKAIVLSVEEQKDLLMFFKKEKPVMFINAITEE